MNQKQTEVLTKPENPILNLLFNIILPVFILNQLNKRLGENGALYALIIALLFPLIYGIYDFIKRKKANYISVLGLINISVTGGFALLNRDGIWFAFKEAIFPLLIGIAVFFSVYFKKPFIKTIFWNDHIFKISNISEKIKNNGADNTLFLVFQRATLFFGISFLISAALNFILALKIFLPIDPTLSVIEHREVLNHQIAQMTWRGYLTIALPMMVFMMSILWYVIHNLKKLSGLNLNDLMTDGDHSEPGS